MVSCSRPWLVHVLLLGPHHRNRNRPPCCHNSCNRRCGIQDQPQPPRSLCNIQLPSVDGAVPVTLAGAAPLVLSLVHTSGSHNYVVDAVVVLVVVPVVCGSVVLPLVVHVVRVVDACPNVLLL